jgi:SAM-dependent methyltransferase
LDQFDLYNISENYMELLNPTSSEKILTLGRYLRLKEAGRVIDFGCGFAEPLVLWAERFSVSGIGIDIRPYACERAREKIKKKGLQENIEHSLCAGCRVCLRRRSLRCSHLHRGDFHLGRPQANDTSHEEGHKADGEAGNWRDTLADQQGTASVFEAIP